MDNTIKPNRLKLYLNIERILVALGAVICLAVVGVFSGQQGGYLWPLPGGYFIEIGIMAILGAASRLLKIPMDREIWKAIPWVVAGVLLPFVLLGGFSIGPFLLPAMLLFFLAGAITDRRLGQGLGAHLGIAILAALIQGFIIILANMLYLAQSR